MTLEAVIKTFSQRQNGAWIKIRLSSPMLNKQTAESRKNKMVVRKEVVTTVRKGVKYGNIKSVQEKLTARQLTDSGNGTPGQLPWGTWYKNSKTIIEHKGNFYARLYTSPNKPKVKYYLNNNEISAKDLQLLNIMQPSYWKNKENKDSVTIDECMTVKIENIAEIY